jgi:hypothetical protein
MSDSEGNVTLDRVVKAFVKIRDKRSEEKRAWEAKDRELKDQQETLESFLLGTMQTLGAKSVKTDHGTVYSAIEVTPQASDWDAFYAWVAEENAFEALEKRIKKTFVVAYMEDHDGELPPGVQVFRQHTVTIRRS